jgi:hypothetical protein
MDPSGHFDAWASVPATADGRRLTLRATCAGGVVLAADFTVLGGPPAPQPPPLARIPWLAIVLITAAALGGRGVCPPPQPQAARSAPAGPGRSPSRLPPVITLRETPEPGEKTYALRLEAHAGLGTITVREVDDDHTAG